MKRLRGRLRSMPWLLGPLLGPLLGLLACSGGDLLVDLDLQSFVTESGTLDDPNASYAALTLSTPVTITGLTLLPPSSVGLVDVIDDVSSIRAVRFLYAIETAHREGDARAVIRIRLAATQAGLAAAAAVIDTLALDLAPATNETFTQSVDLRDDLVALFRGSELWLAADGDVRVEAATAPGDSIAGRIWLRAMDARIVADRDFF